MDFFGAQEQARRLSGWLVALFLLAVLVIALVVYVVLAAILLEGETLWDAALLAVTIGTVGLVVGLASTARSASLRAGGGAAVAEMLGGRLIPHETSDPDERRLMNVVEEIALAAGTPVPAVYVLDQEHAINAFAAGYSPDDAVVAMTRGAMQAFDRDEMQAVVAHEFSHIVNRDIRLNIRLVGLLFGVLALGLGGRMLLRASFYSRGGRRDGRTVAAMVAVGLTLFVLGYLGVLMGRIIRAAVSRQREYLADAAAVQFTRNADGMASALKKIGAVGSRLQTASAEEASHFFFANGLRSGLVSGLWATHPPLVERIRRVDPAFDGDFSQVRLDRERREEAARPAGQARARRHALPEILVPVMGAAVIAEGDRPAAVPPESIPPTLRDAAHDPFSAVALMYAIILDRDERAREPQLDLLRESVIPAVNQEVRRLLPDVDTLPSDLRIALVDLAAPALRLLSDAQSERMLSVLERLAAADRKLSIFEFALTTAVRHRMAATHGNAAPGRAAVAGRDERHARILIGTVAHAGSPGPELTKAAYEAGLREADLTEDEGPPPATHDDVRSAFEALAEAPESVRRSVLAGCVAAATYGGQVVAEERYLLRALASALNSPMPRLVGTSGQARTADVS